MASLSSLPTLVANNNTIFPPLFPFSQSKNNLPRPRNRRYGDNYVPCRASNGDQSNPEVAGGDSSSKFDRRDVLFGLGGLYGAATLGDGKSKPAMADPVTTPNVSNCGPSIILDPGTNAMVGKINCCPPSPDGIFDFFPPKATGRYRVRPAAHLMTREQVAKFEEAIRRMKQLDPSDPRNFYQQANIHCAYCNVGYEQDGFPGIDLQVHFNWLFFPFHRCYLYFYERILGHLINDPTFALPFWNFDHPDGMQMPAIYDKEDSPLYNANRNQKHRPPKVINLNYSGTDEPISDSELIYSNLRLMYQQMVTHAKNAEQFHGMAIRAGDPPESGMGSIENVPHNNIHFWGGNPNNPNGEDLGNFYSSGRDTLFYGLHTNVDRLWGVWKKLEKGRREDFTDADWLGSSFIFYDENKNAIRIRVRDCLGTKNLGYIYQDVPNLWKDAKSIPSQRKQLTTITKIPAKEIKVPEVSFPLVLSSKITTAVQRPKKLRSNKEKDEEDEVLVIEGIQYDRSLRVHFDVLINVVGDEKTISPANSEFAGSFVSVPHLHKHSEGEFSKTSLRLVLTELIDDLDCDNDDTVFVTLVPKQGAGKVKIGGIKIKFISIK